MTITPLAGTFIRRSPLQYGFSIPYFIIASYPINSFVGTVEGRIDAKKPAFAILRRDPLAIAVINSKLSPYAIVTAL